MKRLLLLAGILVAAVTLPAHPAAAASPAPTLLALRAATAFERIYVASTGESIRISVSDQLVPDEAENQHWAEFLAHLPHGGELERVTLYIAPLRELRQICGRESLACYSGSAERIVFPSESLPNQPTREAILAHEYGHHLGRNRSNLPWPGLLHGTKRWATYTGVCAGLRAGRLSLEEYRVSPAETFAETYRVLAETRLGLEPTPWTLLDTSLQPDERALALLEQDIAQPWLQNAVLRRQAARSRTFRFATPLDGRLIATLRAPRTAVYELRVAGRSVRARGRGPATATSLVCGTRQAAVTVRKVSGRGTYRLVVSRP